MLTSEKINVCDFNLITLFVDNIQPNTTSPYSAI